jgi:anti-sigma B factor antagonist
LRDFECEAELVGDDIAVVTVRGELDSYTAERFRKALRKVKAWRVGSRLVVDLTECSFMDSTALGALMEAKRQLGEAPLNVAAHVGALRVLTISGFDKVLRIHKTREEALAALGHEPEPEAPSSAP